jgi:ribosomal protein L13E
LSKEKSKTRKVKEPKKEAKEIPKEVTKKLVVRPQGKAPFASVTSRHGTVMIARQGKGFSFGEIEGASLPLRLVGNWKVPLDSRRRSVSEENVAALRKWYVAPTEVAKQAHEKVAPVVAAPAVAHPRPRRVPKKKPAAKKKKSNPKKSRKSKK